MKSRWSTAILIADSQAELLKMPCCRIEGWLKIYGELVTHLLILLSVCRTLNSSKFFLSRNGLASNASTRLQRRGNLCGWFLRPHQMASGILRDKTGRAKSRLLQIRRGKERSSHWRSLRQRFGQTHCTWGNLIVFIHRLIVQTREWVRDNLENKYSAKGEIIYRFYVPFWEERLRVVGHHSMRFNGCKRLIKAVCSGKIKIPHGGVVLTHSSSPVSFLKIDQRLPTRSQPSAFSN